MPVSSSGGMENKRPMTRSGSRPTQEAEVSAVGRPLTRSGAKAPIQQKEVKAGGMTAKKVGSAGSSASAADPDYVEEGNLLGSLGPIPIPPETKAANEVLDLRFKAYMSKMKCTLSKGCVATGKFIKTGRDSNGRMRIKCTSCNATTTNVATMIEKAGGPPAKSVATATPVNTEKTKPQPSPSSRCRIASCSNKTKNSRSNWTSSTTL